MWFFSLVVEQIFDLHDAVFAVLLPAVMKLSGLITCEWRLFGQSTKLPDGFCGVRFSGLFMACWKVLWWKLCKQLCEMGLHDV